MAPKELYVEISEVEENFITATKKAWDDTDIKYLRADLAVDREKLVEWLENSIEIDCIGIGGPYMEIAFKSVIEKLKEL